MVRIYWRIIAVKQIWDPLLPNIVHQHVYPALFVSIWGPLLPSGMLWCLSPILFVCMGGHLPNACIVNELYCLNDPWSCAI
jgi:hypothetical protein